MSEKYLFTDAEATGLINRKLDLMDPSQPRIMQLAAILTDEENHEIAAMNVYIKPDGWTVPEEVTALTGISQEILEAEGIPMPEALEKYNSLKFGCTMRVGHNISYDKQLLAREANAYALPHDSSGKASFCTMFGTAKIVSEGKKYKIPKLAEAYEHFMGHPPVASHDAWADVQSCREIFFALKKWQAASKGAA